MSRQPRPSFILSILWAALLLVVVAALASAVEVPYLTGRVVDAAEILSPAARAQIGDLLKAHEQRSGNQVAVLTLPSLGGESIEDFAHRVFESWGLGQADRDNGVLLLIAPKDRRMRIEVGYGLEGTLTDLMAGRIIRNVMTPRFREDDYDAGVEDGARAIISILEGAGEVAGETSWAEDDQGSEDFSLEIVDLPIMERILFGAFIFGIIGLFTVLGVMTPGVGWFLYVFLIPFWAMFPIAIVGVRATLVLLGAYLVLFPIAKILISQASWHHRAVRDLKNKGTARIGGFTFGSGGSSGRSSGGSSWSSGSSGFSGGGGSSGGGGASGSW